MKKYIQTLIHKLKPYSGIIYFLTVLFASHFLWKWVVDGDINSQKIAFFGQDCTPWFYQLSQWTAEVIYRFCRWFPGTEELYLFDTRLYFSERNIILNIIWGCTGVKQLYVFLSIMLFYPGPWKKKMWYLPVGAFILWVYNIVRVAAIIFLTRHHPEWFDDLHEGLFRYLYYGLIFFLWVYWEEKIRKPKVRT